MSLVESAYLQTCIKMLINRIDYHARIRKPRIDLQQKSYETAVHGDAPLLYSISALHIILGRSQLYMIDPPQTL